MSDVLHLQRKLVLIEKQHKLFTEHLKYKCHLFALLTLRQKDTKTTHEVTMTTNGRLVADTCRKLDGVGLLSAVSAL